MTKVSQQDSLPSVGAGPVSVTWSSGGPDADNGDEAQVKVQQASQMDNRRGGVQAVAQRCRKAVRQCATQALDRCQTFSHAVA